MTIEILGPAANSPHVDAAGLRNSLIRSAPELAGPEVRLALIPQVFAGRHEIDCVVIFEDHRPEHLLFKTADDTPVRSFVLCLEVKRQSPDNMRLHGTHVQVMRDGGWIDASAELHEQIRALKTLQTYPYWGASRRHNTMVHGALWFPHVIQGEVLGEDSTNQAAILWAMPTFRQLIAPLEPNRNQGKVQTLVDAGKDNAKHSFNSLVDGLTAKVEPTKLDLKRVNELTRKRFNDQGYVAGLGSGLLMFRGRAGTGKTFALIQMAIHLARQGKRTRIVTYNHGLISDMRRALTIIRDRHPDISPIPEIDTRWMLMSELFAKAYGPQAMFLANKLYVPLDKRENLFQRALCHPTAFRKEAIPCCASQAVGKACFCKGDLKTWASISKPPEKLKAPYDFLLVDEGQDWSVEQRDLMYSVFGAQNVIVADGVDQFVTADRCNWDRGDIAKNKIVTFRTSRRTKAATCETIADIAKAFELPGWDVVPDPSLRGGRITILVEPDHKRAVKRTLEILERDLQEQPTVERVDALVCLPSPKVIPGFTYEELFAQVCRDGQEDFWDGYDEKTRQAREYPTRPTQLRAVRYQSCRGMEGWTTLCMALDRFYDDRLLHPEINRRQVEESLVADLGLFSSVAEKAKRIANAERVNASNWLMIPLTRSMDHLVIHLTREESALGDVLRRIDGDKVTWERPTIEAQRATHLQFASS